METELVSFKAYDENGQVQNVCFPVNGPVLFDDLNKAGAVHSGPDFKKFPARFGFLLRRKIADPHEPYVFAFKSPIISDDEFVSWIILNDFNSIIILDFFSTKFWSVDQAGLQHWFGNKSFTV